MRIQAIFETDRALDAVQALPPTLEEADVEIIYVVPYRDSEILCESATEAIEALRLIVKHAIEEKRLHAKQKSADAVGLSSE